MTVQAMPSTNETKVRRRVYHLRPLRNPKRGAIQDVKCRHHQKIKWSEKIKFKNSRRPVKRQQRVDKMVQTSSADLTAPSKRDSLDNDDKRKLVKARSPSPLPNLSEGDISALLGILDTSTASEEKVTRNSANTPATAPNLYSSPLHYIPCSCRNQSASWCSHACIPPEVQQNGCRQSCIFYTSPFYGNGCMCSNMFRQSPCNISKHNGPVA